MKFPIAPVLLADVPQLGSWQVAVVRVDVWECPRAEQNRQRPIDLSEVSGDVRPVLPAGVPPPPPLVGSVNSVGPCGMPSPYAEKIHEPLQHSVLIQDGPAGRPSAVGTLSPSDYYPVGPAGPYVAGGPGGPDVCFTNPDPVKHTVLVHADPAGQDVSAVGTSSPPDCYPAGPAGPYVAGGPVGPDNYSQVLESCEKLVLDHADPAGQHAVVLDTTESLGDAVAENILDGPMEGITCPELLEYSHRLLVATLDSGLVKNISDWEPEARPVPDATLDSRLTEGITNLEHSAPGVSLDSGPMEGMLCLEPSEQSVLNSSLVTRPSKCVMEERSEWKPVINPVISYTLDSRLMEGNTYLERSALGVDLRRGRRVWNHWSSRFLVRR